MANFKIKIIFFNIALFFSLSAQTHECRQYFKKSDFALSHFLSMEDFRRLETLASFEISTSNIENAILKSAILDEVNTKLVEMLQAGVRIETYQKTKEFVLRDMKRRKELENKNLRKQEQQLNDLKIDGTRAVFHRIEAGTFLMGEVGKQVLTTISEPFDLMATQTTQIIWRTVAELANSKLRGKYNINVNPSRFKGDTRPVESISHTDIKNWINALNELSQLGETVLTELFSGHKKGDVYRLPWEMEWEFVVRGRGKYNDVYHFGNKESELEEYGWFQGNSAKETHPVAQKKPLLVEAKAFFDMHGNVWELVINRDNKSLSSGTAHPTNSEDLSYMIRGGSLEDDAASLSSAHRYPYDLGFGSESVSFRMLRVAN